MARAAQLQAEAPSAAFLERIAATLPALLMIVDTQGVIQYSAGSLGAAGARSSEDLVGTRVTSYVDASEIAAVTELLQDTAKAPNGEYVGPARVSYRDREGLRRTTEVWAVNRADDPQVAGIVLLLLPESAYDRYDQILMQVVAGASLSATFGSLAQALRYPPVSAESYFVMPAKDDRGVSRVPDLAEVAGPPGPGPWDEIWEPDSNSVFKDVSSLSEPLRGRASKAGFGSIACYPVHRGLEGRPDACLVVWSRAEGPPALNSRLAIERAAAIASLAISHVSAEEGLRDAAYRDALTGLGNRRSFFEAMEVQVVAGEQPAVLYIDLDGFKETNDTLGHLAGDAVLRVVARRLASVMRPTDELARLGGDEFAVLCSGPVSVDQMGAIAERVVAQLNRPLSVGDGITVDIGASIGIALGLPVGTPVDTVLSHADRALYDAKARGRGRWAFADARQEARTQ